MNENQTVYKILRFLWLFVLLPKEIQLIAFIGILVIQSRKKTLKKMKVYNLFLVYMMIHFISITVNIILGDYNIARIFAAFNTCLIWGIAVFIAGIVSYEINVEYVGKIFARNIMILTSTCVITRLLGINSFNYIIDNRTAWRMDWLTTGTTMRFRGFFEYDTLVVLFVIIQLPLAIYYLNKKYNIFVQYTFLIIAFIPVVATISRMGILLMGGECGVLSWYILDNSSLSKKSIKILKTIEVFFVLLIGIVFLPSIENGINSIFNLRGGSNEARERIYRTSLSIAWNRSPLIGMGIKEMFKGFPLGSHCTYIGIFYKTGIIGSLVWLAAIIILLTCLHNRLCSKKNRGFGRYAYICVFIVFLALISEDLDGTNWLIVLFFLTVTIYIKCSERLMKNNNSQI